MLLHLRVGRAIEDPSADAHKRKVCDDLSHAIVNRLLSDHYVASLAHGASYGCRISVAMLILAIPIPIVARTSSL